MSARAACTARAGPSLPAARHRLRLDLDYVIPPHEVQALRSDDFAAVVKHDRSGFRVQLDAQRVSVHLFGYGPSSPAMHSPAARTASVSVSVSDSPITPTWRRDPITENEAARSGSTQALSGGRGSQGNVVRVSKRHKTTQ